MCGRFLLDCDIKDVISRYGIINIEYNNSKCGEIFPDNIAPVVMPNKELHFIKWGFPLSTNNKLIINARSENITYKTLFKNSFYNKRCIVPANSFYEWKSEDNRKIKYKISLKDKTLFSMAAIYNIYTDKNNRKYASFVIITTEANKEVSKIHSRMPVIIHRENEKLWLEENKNYEVVEKLLRPYKDDSLVVLPDNGIEQMAFI